jgi:Protein of unknown function (DUF3147)
MLVRVSASALKNGRCHEYFMRFALGGAVTVLTGWIANRFGPSIGGLFLAVPAIFCASATLIEKHEMRRKSEAGMDGRRRGQQAAALDATGAALGSFGLLAFAASFYSLIGRSITGAFLTAALVWLIASVAGWRAWRSLRTVQRVSGVAHEHARGHTHDA